MAVDKTFTKIYNTLKIHGRKATFLGRQECVFPYAADDLRRLAEPHALLGENQQILDEMMQSLDREGQLPFSWTPQEHFFVTHNADERVVPYLLYRFKFRVFPERHIVADFPVHLLVEPTSACNLRCVMCYQSDRTFNRKPYIGMMDMGLFRDVVDQAADGGSGALSLVSRGEPFMHKDFGEMLRYASSKKRFFDIKTNTNATRLTENACHDLLSSDINVIVISVDAHEKDLYEKIRVRGNFETVLANVRRLCDIRDRQYSDSKVEIRISGVRISDEQNEKEFHDFWSEICDTVVLVRAQKRWNTYENDLHPDHAPPCSFLWDRFFVLFDGTFNMCDEDYKAYLSPGTARESTIREIWHGEALTRLRSRHLAGRRPDIVPCDRCGL